MDDIYKRIRDAVKRLDGIANRTPVLSSRTLNEIAGAEIFLKCESFQRVGAFKFRGAYYAISQLSDDEKKRGVITYSSGNHAQAVGLVGKLLDLKTVIVMPDNAPVIKRQATEGYGAEVVEYNPVESDRKLLAEELAQKHGYTMIPPFDHPDIIAGQGTATMEFYDEVKTLDYLTTPCGGGGLLSGTAVASKNVCPTCKVIGVEPELANDATLSFKTGKLHTVKNPPTIADGARTPSLGNHTFPLVLKYVDDMVEVTEQAIIDTVKFLFYRMKLVVEPSGALGLSAIMSGKLKVTGRAGVIISGGNIDSATMNKILDS